MGNSFCSGLGLPWIAYRIECRKKVGKVGQKVDASEFREACRKYANSQIDLQKKDFKRLGVLEIGEPLCNDGFF